MSAGSRGDYCGGTIGWTILLAAALSCACPVWAVARSGPAPQDAAPQQPGALAGLLAQAFALHTQYKDQAAGVQFRQVIRLARARHDLRDEAEGHRGLGLTLRALSQPDAARSELQLAEAQFQSIPDALGVARVRLELGALAQIQGNWSTARQLYGQALAAFRQQHDLSDQAAVDLDLGMDPFLARKDRDAWRQLALQLARQAGNKDEEGRALESWADALYSTGDYASAIEKSEAAADCFALAGDNMSLGRLYTSEGRLYRAQGLPGKAIGYYQKGLRIQLAIGDLIGAVQDTNAIAIARDLLGHGDEALAEYSAALALARKSGSAEAVNFTLGNTAGEDISLGRYAAAASLLKQVIRSETSPYMLTRRYLQLSWAEFGLGQYAGALAAVNHALQFRAQADDETIVSLFYIRAQDEDKLGRAGPATADVNAALAELESIRAHLAPDDLMKRHFMDRNQSVFDLALELDHERGHDAQALTFAERGRARALDDLLASRHATPTATQALAEAASARMAQDAAPPGAARRPIVPAAGRALTYRGPPAGAASPSGAPQLGSFVNEVPLNASQMAALAGQLHTTILSYWVAETATYIWVVQPNRQLHAARVEVAASHLRALARRLWPAGPPQTAQPDAPSDFGPQPSGSAKLQFGSNDRQSWRELYQLLIQPVEAYLPPRGGLLTIEGDGPVLLIPFAALLDAHGHYLIERYALSYAPSLTMLALLRERANPPRRFVLIADPTDPPRTPQGPLPPLPGARSEVTAIARVLPGAQTTLLIGARARKDLVESQLGDASVIHFATHGILDAADPDQSYLALGGAGMSGPDAGRLSVGDIYGLKLHADLVFLSACRTGLGQVSADGMLGMTRAFFYAGASSLIASVWDISDQTTARLVPDFYRRWRQTHDKSRALRQAQLDLLHALRAGRVRVHTPEGTFTLPEDPVLWASFSLEGEPH